MLKGDLCSDKASTFFFDELYTTHKQEIHRHLTKKYHITALDAEDAIHAVFMKFIHLPNCKYIENPRAYLFRMAENFTLDQIRNKQRYERFQSQHRDQEPQVGLGPERIQSARQDLGKLQSSLDAMPEKRLRILKLSRIDGLSNVDIAAQFGVSEAAIRKQLAKAMRDIKQNMNASANEVDVL